MAYTRSVINITTNKKPEKKLTGNLNQTDKAYSDGDSYSMYPITPQISIFQDCERALPKEHQS